MGLVQNRVCGDYTVCCTVAPLVSETIRKLPNVPCRHSAGAGCAIYTTRPTACRESYCGWRFYPELDDGWRPDISGVLILTEQDVPAKYLGRGGLKFLLLDADTSIRSEAFVGYICALVGRGVPVTVSVPGAAGALACEGVRQRPAEVIDQSP